MSRRIIKKPQVETDLIEHFAFIAADKVAPADRFLRVAQEALEQIAVTPGIGRKWESELPELAGMRVYPMPGKYRSYLVFYRVHKDAVEIFAVLHGARDLDAMLGEIIQDRS